MTATAYTAAYAPPDLTFSRALNALAASGFNGALLTDLAYIKTTDYIWVDASDWLVSAGVIAGFAAFVVAIIETIAQRRRPLTRRGVAPAMCRSLAWIVGAVNMFVHSRDGWTSVMPLGVTLSLVTVILVVIPLFLPRTYATPALAPREVI